MKIDWKDWTNWFGAFLLICVTVFLLNRIGAFFELSKSDWAAWVGAVGTVAAFFAAVGVAKWQLSWAHRKVHREDEAKLQALLALAYDYVFMVKIATIRMRAPVAGDFVSPSPLSLIENFEDIDQGVKSIPLHQFPVPDYVPLMLIFRRYARRTVHDLEICSKMYQRGNLSTRDIEIVEEQIKQIRHRARYVLAELRAGVRQYGCTPHDPPEHLTDLTEDWRGLLYDVP